MPASHEATLKLAALATRLEAMDPVTQERLINWGYAICDAGVRKHLAHDLPTAIDLPYPESGVG